MTTGAWVLVAAVAAALAFGAWRAYADGRFHRSARLAPAAPEAPAPSVVELIGADLPLGERATLVQFSSAFCAPCRATRRVLSEVVEVVPGAVHHEVDAELHLEVVRRLGILRTPTTLVLDARGVEVARASGAPTKQQVLAQLAAVL